MMKRIMALLCSAILILGLFGNVSASDDITQGVTIGIAVYNQDDPQTKAFRKYYEEYLGEAFNAKFIYSENIGSWEDEKAFVDSLHELGVKGIISSQSMDREAVIKLCEEYGMYYIFGSSSLSDEVFNSLKDSPSFLGTIGASDESEIQAGAGMAEFFASGDSEKKHSYLICTGGAAVGNEMHRIRGLAMLEKLAEIYGFTYETPAEELIQAEEETEAVNDGNIKITLLPGYPYHEVLEKMVDEAVADGDYDTLMSTMIVDNVIESVRAAEESNQMEIRVGAIDCFTEESYDLFNGTNNGGKQELDYLAGRYGASVAPAFTAICNAYAGYAEEFRDHGHAFRLHQKLWTAASTEEFNRLYELSVGMYENTYSASDIMKVLKAFNSEVTFEDFKEFAER